MSAISLLVAYYTTRRLTNSAAGATLIVCPATIINQWRKELKMWAEDYLPEVMIYNSEVKARVARESGAEGRNEFVLRKRSVNRFVKEKQGIIVTSYD